MTVKMNIAAGLKSARKAAGMSVEEVGAALGKSGKTISAWEVGRGQPDGDELIVLCRLLGAHLRDFYGEEYDDVVSDRCVFDDLTADEQELVRMYRNVTEYQKPGVLFVLSQMEDNDWVQPTICASGQPGNYVPLDVLQNDGYIPYPMDYKEAIEYGKKFVAAFDTPIEFKETS